MARIKLKQILSNMSYDESTNKLIVPNLLVSGSNTSSLVVSGSVTVTSTPTTTGSITIINVDTFGDSGSFNTLDLGNNSF